MNQTTEHDPAIGAAYDRLGATLRAPADGPDRVRRRIVVRRRRRRAATGLAALVLVGGVGAAAVTTGGEPDRAVDVATQPPADGLGTTLADGTTYTFEGVEVTCTEGTITAQTRPELVGRGEDERLVEPFLHIEARPSVLAPGTTLRLPLEGPGGSEDNPLLLFFATDDAGPEHHNELSSAEDGSSGTVVVHEASCGPEPVLSLTVDAVLGSELADRPAMPLTGELR
ncbi:hypothetical protein QWY28_03040 [Nocardioides sp. SOB77]|uniref:Uncharacterized protein n=1 Tax=Nocardioides oceani TaxID=3058369 RepID=A0ABT8FBD9_9ACTN|nr:hypothetical protein [Nocardioides oceani]MDN4171911.1 hypothetical protein [Nocardioides oceani]